jgi:phosphate transport system protein
MTPYSTRQTFDRHLQNLLEQVLALGSLVDQAVMQAVQALKRHDRKAARRIYEGDQLINESRFAIENECVALIATQQPMARDVRFLASILEIITELERIGDYAKGIAKITLLLPDELSDVEISADLQHMADIGLAMLRQALDAFISGDADTARAIPADDDAVDALYGQVYQKLLRRMIADTTTIEHASYLMWAAHNLERLADRVLNICERTVYVSTGSLKELDPGYRI